MSMYVNVDETDTVYDADDLDLFSHSLSIEVEYYRSFKYNMKWKKRTYSLRSSSLTSPSKKSVQKSPTSSEKVSRYKLRGQRGKEAGDCVVDGDNRKSCDTGYITDDGQPVVIVSNGLDESEEDLVSECSSIASGPSIQQPGSSRKLKSSQALCSACGKLYQRAKRTTTPIKSKLLDNDPKSLTCDQWTLIKKWAPRRLPDARPKLDEVLALMRRKQPEESPACSRLHVFLQRELRRARLQTKKERKSRRKRRRDGSQGCRVAKQQRLQSNSCQQHNTPTHMDDKSNRSFSSDKSSARYRNPKMDNRGNQEPTVELSPSLVPLETTKLAKPKEVRAEQKTQKKKTDGFRDLLAQLRGNSNMIVKESR